jgi:hypothetical protein
LELALVEGIMALTDTFARHVKHSGAASGDKHADGLGMYLLVKAVGKYWRMNYRFGGKQKTIALGVYPEVGLAEARRRRADARAKLAQGVDPLPAKDERRHAPELVLEQALMSEAAAWGQAEKIRAYLAHVAAGIPANGAQAGTELRDWLTWAAGVADRLDPTRSRLR